VAALSLDPFGKGSPIGSNRRDLMRDCCSPGFSLSGRDISVRSMSLLKCKQMAKQISRLKIWYFAKPMKNKE